MVMGIRYLNLIATVFLVVLLAYVLFLGKFLLIPLAVALLFWYIIVRITHFYQHLPRIRWRMPNYLALLLAIITAGGVIYLFFLLLSRSFIGITHDASAYQQKLQQAVDWVNQHSGNHFDLKKMVSQINLTQFFSKFTSILSSVAGNFVLILVYMTFLLLEYRSFDSKLQSMCKSPEQFSKIKLLINKIDKDISSYLKIKTIVNAIAGLLTYILLLIFHIHHAEFWGILTFLLHYIPFIGPFGAIVLILLAASIQIVHVVPFILLAALLGLLVLATGNFLEPKWMGNRLNLSPLVILLSLTFWTALWGIIGALLCVPIMVILILILARFPSTRFIAIMLSGTGKIESIEETR